MEVKIKKVFHEQKILEVESVESVEMAVKSTTCYVLYEDVISECTGGEGWMEGDRIAINFTIEGNAHEIDAFPEIMNTLFHKKYMGANVTSARVNEASDSEGSEEVSVTTAKVKTERSPKHKKMSDSAILFSDYSHANNPRRQRLLVKKMSEVEVMLWLEEKFGTESRYVCVSNFYEGYSKVAMVKLFKRFAATDFVFEADGTILVEFAGVKIASKALTALSGKKFEKVSESLVLEFYRADNIIDFFTHFGGGNVRTFTNWYTNKKKGLRCFLREELVKRLGSISVYYKVVRFIRFEDTLPKTQKILARRMFQIKLYDDSKNLRKLFWNFLVGKKGKTLAMKPFLRFLIGRSNKEIKNGYQRRMLVEYFTSYLVGSSRIRVLADFPSNVKYILTTRIEESLWEKILRLHKKNVMEGRIYELLFMSEYTQHAYPILYPTTLRMCLGYWIKNGFLKENLGLVLSEIETCNLINQKWRNKSTSFICDFSSLPDSIKRVGYGFAMSSKRHEIETKFCERLLQLKATNCLFFYEKSIPQSNNTLYLFPNDYMEEYTRSLTFVDEPLVPKNPLVSETKYICVCYANYYSLEELSRLTLKSRGISNPIFLFHIDTDRDTFSVLDGISNWYGELKTFEKDMPYSDRIIKYTDKPLSIPVPRHYCETLSSKEISTETDLKTIDFNTTLLVCRDEKARQRFVRDFPSYFLRDKNQNSIGTGKGALLFTRGGRKTKEIVQVNRITKDPCFYNASVCSVEEARGMGLWENVWLIGKHTSESIQIARSLGKEIYTIMDSRPLKAGDEVGCSKKTDSEKPKYGAFQHRKDGYFTVVFREKDSTTGLWKRRVQRLETEEYDIWKTSSLNFKEEDDEKTGKNTIHSYNYEGGCCVVQIIQEISKRKKEVEEYNKVITEEYACKNKRKRLQWNTNRQNLKRILQNKLKKDLSMAPDGKFFYKGSNKECDIEVVLKANEEDEDFVATAQRLLKATTMPKIATQRTELA